MLVFLRYTIRETATNLWRNRMMTIAAVLTVAVSLFLVGAALILKQSAAQASAHWQGGTRVTVWMDASASPTEISTIKGTLNSSPFVSSCVYHTQTEDWHEAQQLLPPNEASVLTVAEVPSKFVCVPRVPTDAAQLSSALQGQPGIFQVTAPYQQIRAMQHMIRIVQYVFLALALVLLISATVLILNTIRMAIFARRREVAVMKLVGATNWFIRVPFVTEGFIEGLIGSAIAVVGMTALHTWYPLHGVYQLSTSDLFGTDIAVVAVGVFIGSAGSAMAIRRFLDV